jgi:hypothetical protein
VYFFSSDTTGEKDFEEFYTDYETLVRIPLKPATHSGVILPPKHFMLRDVKESTQVAGMVQASGCSWRPWIARMDIPESESRIA